MGNWHYYYANIINFFHLISTHINSTVKQVDNIIMFQFPLIIFLDLLVLIFIMYKMFIKLFMNMVTDRLAKT